MFDVKPPVLPPSLLIIFDFPIRFLSCPSSNFVSAPSQSLHFPSTLHFGGGGEYVQLNQRRNIQRGGKLKKELKLERAAAALRLRGLAKLAPFFDHSSLPFKFLQDKNHSTVSSICTSKSHGGIPTSRTASSAAGGKTKGEVAASVL